MSSAHPRRRSPATSRQYRSMVIGAIHETAKRLGIRIGMMRILEGLLNIGKQAPALDEQRAREAARTFALREAA